jgi:putative PEP-CTERM system TPR-repeat lipoprotein
VADAASLYEQAQKHFENKDFSTAEFYLKSTLSEAPNFLAAHVLLGRTYLEKGDGALAEKELKSAERLGADQSIIVSLLADAYELQFKYKQILKEIFPGNFEPELNTKIMLKRGAAYMNQGLPDQALYEYREAERYSPRATAPLMAQASVLMTTGRFERADKVVSRALDIDSKDPAAWYRKGMIAHARGRFQDAVKSYVRALELDPKNHAIRIALVAVRMDLGKNKKALRDLQSLSEDDGSSPLVSYLSGVVQARLGDFDASRAAMQKAQEAIAALPAEVLKQHGETLLLASLVEYSLGEWEKARDHLKGFVASYPNNPAGRKLLGMVFFEKGDYDRAASNLELALRQLPNDYKLLTVLGAAYVKKYRYLSASELLDRAVSLSGAGLEARTQRALVELASGSEELGMKQLREVFSQSTDAREAGVVLVLQHLKRGENRSAVEVAKQLSRRDPDNLQLLNLLAGAETAAGDFETARNLYQQMLAKDPDLLEAGVNLAKIDRAEGKLEQAGERLAGLAEKHADNVLVMVEQARLEQARGKLGAAIKRAEKVVALDEFSLGNQLYLGELYLKAQNYKQLRRLAQKLGRLFPRNRRVMELVGRGYLAQGLVEKARNEFRNMSKEVGYKDTRALMRVAMLSRAAGDLDWAAWSLVKALEIDPQWLEARLLLGETYLQEDKLQRAADVVAYLTENYPDNAATHRMVGDLAMAKGDAEPAIEEYRQALQKGGGQDVVLRLFRAYLGNGDTAAAVRFLKGHLPKDGALTGNPTLAAALAEGYLRLDDSQAAQEIYQQLVAAGLKDATVFNNLALIYSNQGDARALDMARRAQALAPERSAVGDTLGWLLVKAGKPGEGLRYLRNANLRNTAARGIRYHIAVALVDLGRTEEATRELHEILSDDQAFSDRQAAASLLRRVGGVE